MNEPLVLQIETTNLCNAKCIFCPHSKIKELGTMNDKLFKKILKEAKEIKSLQKIIPMLNGEPFMDPNFIKRLKMINRALPNIPIWVFTNGSLLTPKLVKKLKDINNLSMIFSLNAATKETRKRLMGLDDYWHTVIMIEVYKYITGKPFTVTMIRYPDIKGKELKAFLGRWGPGGQIVPYKNFAGNIYNTKKPMLNCHRARAQMTVNWKGQVTLCCMDMLSEVIFGDLNKQTIQEVWNSPSRQFYVNAHSTGKIVKGLCENCAGA